MTVYQYYCKSGHRIADPRSSARSVSSRSILGFRSVAVSYIRNGHAEAFDRHLTGSIFQKNDVRTAGGLGSV